MLLVVMIVLFTMTMFLWLLGLLGASSTSPGTLTTYSPWLAFFACLILGVVVFLLGSGVITAQRVAL